MASRCWTARRRLHSPIRHTTQKAAHETWQPIPPSETHLKYLEVWIPLTVSSCRKVSIIHGAPTVFQSAKPSCKVLPKHAHVITKDPWSWVSENDYTMLLFSALCNHRKHSCLRHLTTLLVTVQPRHTRANTTDPWRANPHLLVPAQSFSKIPWEKKHGRIKHDITT